MRSVKAAGILSCTLVVALCLLASDAKAVDRRWNTQAGNWDEPHNWDPNTSIPTLNDTAIIDKGEAQITQANAEAQEVYLGQQGTAVGRGRAD